MTRIRRLTVAAALLAVLLAVPMFGAATTGTMKVTVTDASGAALPGVTVEASSPTSISSRTEVTDASGVAMLNGMLPGKYTVKVTLTGFQPQTLTTTVSPYKTTEVNAKLGLTGVSESITVTAAAPLVETKRATLSDEVTLEKVEALPVSRDYRGYAQLVSGVNVVPNQGGRELAVDPSSKGGNNYRDRTGEGRTGGTGSRDNEYFIDGLVITDIYTGVGSMTFNNEVILQQQVITSGVPAEYSGGRGFVGNIVTKSGGNEFSGSVNYYLMSKDFYSDFKSKDTRLYSSLEDKKDAAATLGGPIWRDRIWFFLSGQLRDNQNEVQLSSSASPSGGATTYKIDRKNYFGKLTAKLTDKTTLTAHYFEDPQEISGSQDVNLPPGRYVGIDSTPKTTWGWLQHIFGNSFLMEGRAGQMKWDYFEGAQNPDLGPQNTVVYAQGDSVPAYQRLLGGSSTNFTQVQKRDQLELTATYFKNALGSHAIKGGVQRHKLQDMIESTLYSGRSMTSIAPKYAGINWADVYAKNISRTDYAYIYNKLKVDTSSNAFKSADTNGDGVLSEAEFAAITFSSTADNSGGINFFRSFILQSGANNVVQEINVGFLQDDWSINNITLNLGLRIDDLKYVASDSSTILDVDPTLSPRLGFTYDIAGQGRQKVSAFYGRYQDPVRMDMVHFAGNISGRVLAEQAFIGNDWYTYRLRGSRERRDAAFAPNLKNPYTDEFSLTYGINLSPILGFTAQAYRRTDHKLIEDYDPAVFIDPSAGPLQLTWADFGWGPEGAGNVNFFLANLVGAKRTTDGIDLALEKRFSSNWAGAFQYSYKRGEGNTSSDGNADLQGDLLEVDPRQPYMNGRLPGTVPHQVKVFGSYRTPWKLELGGLLYYSSGAYFTEGDRAYGIIIPHDLTPNDTTDFNYTKIGAKQHPSYVTFDTKLRYQLGLVKGLGMDFFLDVYNVFNNQDSLYYEVVHNDNDFPRFGETRANLDPRRFQLGVRLTF